LFIFFTKFTQILISTPKCAKMNAFQNFRSLGKRNRVGERLGLLDICYHAIFKRFGKAGITFGWDIRPDDLQGWILRTNLRWHPNLNVNMPDGKQMKFDQLEFNFIQLVLYPERLWGKKLKM
jgi:hypothetical protein